MRIIHVIGSIDPAHGGPATVVVRMAAAQSALGHDVEIVSYADPAAQGRIDRALATVPGLSRVHRNMLEKPAFAERATGLDARRLLVTRLEGADFVHLHGVWEQILRQAAATARRLGVPYCVRPAGMLDPWSLQQKSWKKRMALHLGFRRMLNDAAFIHTLNRDEARLLRPVDLQAPSRTIPNGIFLEEIEPLPAPESFFARVPKLRGRRYVVFISRLHAKKGLDFLADSFARVAPVHPDVDLVVAGPDGGAEISLRRAIAQRGLGERVHLVGPLYGADKIAALVGSACFCLPSRQEGFSLAITEALACGTPVVVSKQCHFPEVALSGAGFVVDLDPSMIADALCEILCDAASATKMGKAGRRLVEERYTWTRIAEATIDAYQRRSEVVPEMPFSAEPA